MVFFPEEIGCTVLYLSFVHAGMTNFAVYEVKRAERRWMRVISHHLEPKQFASMMVRFRRSLRHKRWHRLTSEVKEAIVALAAGNGQSLALYLVSALHLL